MKHLSSLLLAIALLTGTTLTPARAQGSSTPPAAAQGPVAPTQAPPTQSPTAQAPSSYKDQFLALALSKATKYSGKIEDAIGTGVDAAEKEAPVLAAQYLKWHFVSALLDVATWVVLFIVFLTVARKVGVKWMEVFSDPNRFERPERAYPEWSSATYARVWKTAPISIVSIIGAGVTAIGTLHHLDAFYTMAEIYFAPHVYLVEQALQLLHRQ